MLHLTGVVEELDIKKEERIRLWHKIGDNFSKDRYLGNDTYVSVIKNHVSDNYELEIYTEHGDGSARIYTCAFYYSSYAYLSCK